MTTATLTPAEVAAELGRSESWLYAHWPAEVKAGRLAKPLHAGASPLRWNRAHFYAVLDRDLPPPARVLAAAWRAALAAAADSSQINLDRQLSDAAWRDRLDRRFGSSTP